MLKQADFLEPRPISDAFKKGVVRVQYISANLYLFKVNSKNTIKRCEICSKLTIKTHFTPCSSISIVDFERLNVSWDLSNQTSFQHNSQNHMIIEGYWVIKIVFDLYCFKNWSESPFLLNLFAKSKLQPNVRFYIRYSYFKI